MIRESIGLYGKEGSEGDTVNENSYTEVVQRTQSDHSPQSNGSELILINQ